MTTRMLAIVVLVAAFIPLGAGLAKAPVVNWHPFDYSAFEVSAEEGNLASCAYRALKDGKPLEVVSQKRLKVVAFQTSGGEVKIELYASDTGGSVTEATVKDAFQDAIDACYEKLSD